MLGAAVVLVASAALTATAGTTGVSAATPSGTCADTSKCFALVLSPATVPASSPSTITATATNESPAGTGQQLGSMNITAPAGFTIRSVTPPTTGSATVVGNVVQLRNLAIAPKASAAFAIQVTDPSTPGTYTWAVQGKQSNEFNGTGNDFVLDAANSSLTSTVPPGPSADLSVASGGDSPDPVTAGNRVLYTLTVMNNGPNASTVTVGDSVSNGTIRQVPADGSAAGWTCTALSATSASVSCDGGSFASGESRVLTVLVQSQGSVPTTSTSCGNAAVTGMCNTETVSGSVPDNSSANNTATEPTTIAAYACSSTGQTSCGTSYIVYSQPSTVTTGAVATPAHFTVGTTSFPAVSGASGGTLFTMHAPTVPGTFCPFNGSPIACTFEMDLQAIPAAYAGHPASLELRCDVSKCPVGAVSGAGTEIVKSTDDGSSTTVLQSCSLVTAGPLCYDQRRETTTNNLVVTIKGLLPGDPKFAGVCLPPTNSC